MGKKRMTRKQKRKQQQPKKKVNNMKKDTSTQTNFKTTTTSTWKSSKADCHYGQNIAFTTPSGISVYAGGRNRGGGWWKCNPMVQLAIGPSETMKPFNASALSGSTTVPEGWSCDQFVGRIDPPLIISMDFPDFGVPQVEDYFWYALVDDIHEYNIKTISTQCAGGHGRTGVQLAILYYLLNDDMVRSTITDAGQLIELVRDLHCHHAVETNEQQKYIARVLDIEVGKSVIVDRYGGWGAGKSTTNYYGGGGGLGKATTTTGATTTVAGSYELSEKYNMIPLKEQDYDDLFAPEDGDDTCECCGNETFDLKTEECFLCTWELPSKEEMLCYTCGSAKPEWAFLDRADEECINCMADKEDILSTPTEVYCAMCKSMRPQDMVKHKNPDGFACLSCWHGVPVVEVKE